MHRRVHGRSKALIANRTSVRGLGLEEGSLSPHRSTRHRTAAEQQLCCVYDNEWARLGSNELPLTDAADKAAAAGTAV